MSLQTAFEASDIIEAHIVRGMLEAEGLQAWVGGHYLQGAVGEIPAFGTARVQVLDVDLPRARALIEAYLGSQVEENEEPVGVLTPKFV
ncbi:MAG TPA: DUF2007 domain-containing protein [Hyphomicrobiales bacterium]|nr:DUF2007 domain-containing protein [Hyphomicrobiales bacterium]